MEESAAWQRFMRFLGDVIIVDCYFLARSLGHRAWHPVGYLSAFVTDIALYLGPDLMSFDYLCAFIIFA